MGNTVISTILETSNIPIDDKVWDDPGSNSFSKGQEDGHGWVHSKDCFVSGQGSCTVQMLAMLGLNTTWMSRVGEDAEGHWARRHLSSLGIDLSPCLTVPGAQTMSSYKILAKSSEEESSLAHVDPRLYEVGLDEFSLEGIDVVYSDGHQLDLVMPTLKKAQMKGITIIAGIDAVTPEVKELVAIAKHVVASSKCIRELAGPGAGSIERSLLRLANANEGLTVIATEGYRGSYGAQTGDARATHVMAHRCKVTDQSGAGQAYTAGFVVASLEGRALKDAMSFSSRVAAASCETRGPVASREALRRFEVSE